MVAARLSKVKSEVAACVKNRATLLSRHALQKFARKAVAVVNTLALDLLLVDKAVLARGADMAFEVTVDVRPEFELPDLKTITVTRPALEVTDEDVEKELERLRLERATPPPIIASAAVVTASTEAL